MLDANLDEMQSELDAKTEELAKVRQQVEKQTLDFSNV